MRFQSGSAFRRALETRLRNESLASGLPLVRLRKMVAFDRLLARLVRSQPDQWVLKGGLALQLRLGDLARTTKDIDLLSLTETNSVFDSLSEAVALILETGLTLRLVSPRTIKTGQLAEFGIRFYHCWTAALSSVFT